jgi:hypothetical protein
MPCIYSQFMEKEARQWRQIYKVYHKLPLWLVFLSLAVMFNLQITGPATPRVPNKAWVRARCR